MARAKWTWLAVGAGLLGWVGPGQAVASGGKPQGGAKHGAPSGQASPAKGPETTTAKPPRQPGQGGAPGNASNNPYNTGGSRNPYESKTSRNPYKPDAPNPAKPSKPTPNNTGLWWWQVPGVGSYAGRGRYVVPAMFNGAAPLQVNMMGQDAQDEQGQLQPPNTVVGGNNATLDLDPRQLVSLLADPMYSDEGKLQAQQELVAGGMKSVPHLVALTRDKRPVSARAGAPSVAQVAEHLLYEIITPDYRSPHEHALTQTNARVMFRVEDWGAFWAANRDASLQDVQDKVKAAVDGFWRSEGQEQVLR